jgi:hypothetical protein
MAPTRAHELDYVELVRDVDGLPAGTRGTVVSEYPESALIEVATEMHVDESGLPERDLLDDLVSAPYSALRIVEPASTAAR